METEGLRKRINKKLPKDRDRNKQEYEKKSDEDSGIEEDDTFKEECKEFPYDTYWLSRICFLRGLGGIYLTAFLIALMQNNALLGNEGLLPASVYLKRIEAHFGNSIRDRFLHCPTVLWLICYEDMDWWLDFLAYAGVALSSIVFVFGAANVFIMLALWILYHSITNVGQVWYGFGWESQLLETGFLAMFFCPVFTLSAVPSKSPPSLVVIYAYRWLIFRIMLGAGLIKIRGDRCWRDLTCMNYHYQTQPVPNPISYFLHQTPPSVHALETAGNHIIELVLPFLLFWPRRLRLWSGSLQILFQVILIVSGNLSFLNWLTILPSICCFDDASLQWMFPESSRKKVLRVIQMEEIKKRRKRPICCAERFRLLSNFLLFCLIAYLSVPVVNNLVSRRQAMNRSYDSLRIVNTYGAFGSVTKVRNEVILQGTDSLDPNSKDAVWREYEFKCKPGDVRRRPCLISPYHYRLDWLMWFAAFQNYQNNPWFIHLVGKLLMNDPRVTSLLEKNPFLNESRPKFVRAIMYKYKYSKIGSIAARSGRWWTRRKVDTYLPAVDLDMLRSYLESQGFGVPKLNK